MADHLQSLVGVTKLLFLSILFKYSFAVSHNDQNSDRRAYKLNDNAQSKMPHNVYRQIADDLSIAMSHDSSRSSLNEDFYTPINNSTIDKKTIYLSFINDVHKENTALALRKLEASILKKNSPGNPVQYVEIAAANCEKSIFLNFYALFMNLKEHCQDPP